MKRYRYMLAILLLCLGMGARADNKVTLTGSSGAPGEEVTVTVSMTNSDAVSAMQLSIPMDENLEFVTGSAQAMSRLTNLAVSAGVKDGTLNVMVYSSTLATIAAGDGDLLTFRLKLGNTPTDISLTPSMLTVTGADGKPVSSTAVAGTVSIRCAKAEYSTMTVDFGRVPIRSTYHETVMVNNVGNETLTVTAISFSDPMVFSTTTEFPFEVAAGGSKQIDVTYAPTERGNVQKSMMVTCNSSSKLNTIKLTAQPFAVNELHVGNATGVSDTEVEVVLSMNNMDDIVGFQTEFKLPSALEYVDGSFALNADRKEDHVAGVVMDDDVLRILVYSPSSKALKENDGAIGSFRVKLLGRYGMTLTPVKTVLTAVLNGQATNVLSAQYGGSITIQSPQISSSSELAFGRKPVTGDVEQTYTIRNYGSAPLTVSRIVFLNEGYSVKEELPLTIGTSSSQTITVVRSDKSEGDFSTTMQIYSNDPGLRMKTVSVTGNIFAPNFISVTAANTIQNSDVTLHLSMDNYDAIEGIQFDVVSNDAYSASTAPVVKTTRGSGLSVVIRQMDEQTIRVVCYLMNGSIASGSGRLLSLNLTPVKTLALGQHQLAVKNITLGTNGMQNKYAGNDLNVTFSVNNLTKGDVNGDGAVDIADAVCIVNHVVGKATPTFVEAAADVNGDGVVDIADAVKIVNLVVGKIETLSRKQGL